MSSPNDPYTKENATRFTLRIDTELFDKVKRQAEKNKRSAVKEIEFILERWFEERETK